MQRRNAFTLIELLVVIAIIAILAAILFPVFAQAKLAAKKASDLSNTKQTALAILMYTNDYDDVFPKASYWNGIDPYGQAYMWSSQLGIYPYTKNADILKSPVDTIPVTHDAAYYKIASTRVPKALSYMPNSISPSAGSKLYGLDLPQGLMPESRSMPPFYGDGGAEITTSATAAPAPSTIIMLAGGNKEIIDGVYYCGEWINNEIDWCYGGSGVTEQWKIDSLVLAVQGDRQYPGWRKFSGSSNFAFGDGSAKALRPGDLRDVKRWAINAPTN